jgi:hypothetical protein
MYPLCGFPLWEEYKLRGYSFLKYSRYTLLYYCLKTLKAKDYPLLAVVLANTLVKIDDLERWKIGHLFSYGIEEGYNQSHLFTTQLVSSQPDYITIIQWLEYYRTHHKRLCGDKGQWSPGMKLIDCKSTPLLIIDAPQSASYTALSYV